MTTNVDFSVLLERVGQSHLQRRLDRQVNHVSDVFGPGLVHFHVENWHWPHWSIKTILRRVGMYGRGQRNALSPRIRHHPLRLPNLAPAFAGFRLLHLSDLHCDIHPGMADAVAERIRHEPHDACVLTGDYRFKTYGSYEQVLADMARLRPVLQGPVYAVLGNHDFIEMVAPLEALGYRVLLNESVHLERGTAAVGIAGVDDPHYYEVDDLAKATVGLRPDVPRILLAHTPEIYRQAEAHGFHVMLCGHTHAGQICLPGGIAILLNAHCPRSLCKGAWRYGAMQGYTSRGTGVSGVDVRFNCPGEITIHHLETAD